MNIDRARELSDARLIDEQEKPFDLQEAFDQMAEDEYQNGQKMSQMRQAIAELREAEEELDAAMLVLDRTRGSLDVAAHFQAEESVRKWTAALRLRVANVTGLDYALWGDF